ncbi:MAG: hypothetical protein FWD68_05845 [Alphaproteobacteria bacterium]|nr:hypothetical protein [Alphaproteobacteria bacterium]
MSGLCQSQIFLQNAQASASGRLSTSASTTARISPWQPTSEAVQQWSCAFEDWGRLQTHLQARLTPRLTADRSADVPVLLLLARHAAARFDEISQTLIWPVADSSGRWIGLTLDHRGIEKNRISVLEEITRNNRISAVVATATLEDDRITLRPYALWGTTWHLFDFTPERSAKEASFLADLLQRLRNAATTGPRSFVTDTHATDHVLARAWNGLLRRAESGVAAAQSIPLADDLADDLERAGFSVAARLYRSLAEQPHAEAALRAAYAISVLRLARASLPWMK